MRESSGGKKVEKGKRRLGYVKGNSRIGGNTNKKKILNSPAKDVFTLQNVYPWWRVSVEITEFS